MRRKEPFIVHERPGTRVICSCGKSAALPYCDGSHVGGHREPCVVNLTEEKQVAWCGCRRSRRFPYCDRTHKSL